MSLTKPFRVLVPFLLIGCPLPNFATAIEPCDQASGVLGGFPRAFCLIDTPSGMVGGSIDINVPATVVNVPSNAGATADVDVFILLQNLITGPPAMEYTTTFAWDTPVDPSSLVFREWVGNFNFTPPRAMALTYVNAPDPANEIRPDEFSWTLDANGMATGAQVTQRMLAGIPPEANLPSLERYHWQIVGLEAGTAVTFTKAVSGGAVIPEPPAGLLSVFGLVGLIALQRKGRKTMGSVSRSV